VHLQPTFAHASEIEEIEKHASKISLSQLISGSSSPVYKYGGDTGLRIFLLRNLRYPKNEDSTGTVVVNFTVDTAGKVKNAAVSQSLTKGTDEEALRLIKMLVYTPATSSGKVVESTITLPVSFTSEDLDAMRNGYRREKD